MDYLEAQKKLKYYKSIEKKALSIRITDRQAANNKYNKSTKKGNVFIKNLERHLEDVLWEKVKDYAPFSRDGYPIRFDGLFINDNGVSIRWDADHPNDIIDVDFTFEEL